MDTFYTHDAPLAVHDVGSIVLLQIGFGMVAAGCTGRRNAPLPITLVQVEDSIHISHTCMLSVRRYTYAT